MTTELSKNAFRDASNKLADKQGAAVLGLVNGAAVAARTSGKSWVDGVGDGNHLASGKPIQSSRFAEKLYSRLTGAKIV